MSTTARQKLTSESERKKRVGLSREVCADVVAGLLVVVITGAAFAATPFSTLIRMPDGMLVDTNPAVLISAGFLTALIFVEALRQGGYFGFDQLLDFWGTTRGVVWRFALIILSFIAAGYSLGLTQLLSRGWLLGWAAFSVVGIVGTKFIVAKALAKLSAHGGILCRRVVMVGTPNRTALVAKSAREGESGIEVVAHLPASTLRHHETADFLELKSLVDDGMVDDVIVCPQGDDDDRALSDLLDELRRLPVHVSLAPHPFWLTRGGRMDSVGTVPTYFVQRRPIEGWGILTKMIEDRVLGLLMLLALSPVMLLIAIAVKLDSAGPVLFVQQRQGIAGDVFPIMKFRSMRVMEDGDDVKQATADDDRITRVGRVLRRTSLDELPQLFNVIRGEMSLVGPRPHALKHDEFYSSIIKDYAARHRVKPGMTGWAQVNGYRGETEHPAKMEARLRYDLAYIENWSLWFDLRILILTVKAVLKPENAY